MTRAIGALLALGGAAVLAVLSVVPYTVERADRAVIRLAWRARGERVRQCRRLTPAELERLPAHMRRDEVCERRMLPYRLRVVVDAAAVVDELVRAGGARADRPLFVFRDVAIAPGTHRLLVTFEREGADEDTDEERETAREHAEETPSHLTLERVVTLASREIVLVTYDDEGKALRFLAAEAGGR